MNTLSYLVISPAKDEERYVEATIESVLSQTLRPSRWIVVDDGSSDRTAEIVEKYSTRHEWITLLRRQEESTRGPGSPVIQAFNAGFELAKREQYDFVVKLDCDLRLPPSYFAELMARFDADPRLGIASGVYRQEEQGGWVPVSMPPYHASGACKVIRACCFAEIGGFVASKGWDTVDEIRALSKGWKTRHFADLIFDHLRPEGSARGSMYTNRMHGEVYYLTGGSLIFFLAKVIHRLVTGRPFVLGALMLLAGYLTPAVIGRKRLVNAEEATLYRRMLRQRLYSSLPLFSRWSKAGAQRGGMR